MEEIKNQKETYLDGLSFSVRKSLSFDLPMAQFVLKHKKNSTAYYRNRISDNFLADKARLYLTQADLERIREGGKIFSRLATMDGFIWAGQNCPPARNFKKRLIREIEIHTDIYESVKEKYATLSDYLSDLLRGSIPSISMVRMWNVSIVSSVIFGMFLMTMIYRYFGQGASAGTTVATSLAQEQSENITEASKNGIVLGESVENDEEDEYTAKLIEEYNRKIAEGKESDSMEKEIREMVKGYPIEKMAPYIARKDKIVAAFLVGIAKKESGWGEHAPVYEGQDCHNYWGYKGQRDKMGSGGHTCFDSPQDAVDTVAKRLEFLVSSEKVNTPSKMVVVWKCGYDCSWDNQEAVKKWVSDVDMYFKKFNGKAS